MRRPDASVRTAQPSAAASAEAGDDAGRARLPSAPVPGPDAAPVEPADAEARPTSLARITVRRGQTGRQEARPRRRWTSVIGRSASGRAPARRSRSSRRPERCATRETAPRTGSMTVAGEPSTAAVPTASLPAASKAWRAELVAGRRGGPRRRAVREAAAGEVVSSGAPGAARAAQLDQAARDARDRVGDDRTDARAGPPDRAPRRQPSRAASGRRGPSTVRAGELFPPRRPRAP